MFVINEIFHNLIIEMKWMCTDKTQVLEIFTMGRKLRNSLDIPAKYVPNIFKLHLQRTDQTDKKHNIIF